MKQSVVLSLVLALFVGVPAAIHAQSSGTKSMDMKGMEAAGKNQGATHKGVGVVRTVDTAKGTVTLAHEDIKSLNWPAMTMAFAVKDRTLLDKLETGRKVEFEFVQQGKDYIVTAVK